MKKVIITILFITLMTSLLGCGRASIDDQEPLDIVINAPGEQSQTDAEDTEETGDNPSEGAQGWESLYAPVLNEYAAGIPTNFEGYEIDDKKTSDTYPEWLCAGIVWGYQLVGKGSDIMGEDYHMVYAFLDIDGNGVAELLIGTSHIYNGKKYMAVYDIWTLVNDKPERIKVLQLTQTNSMGLFFSPDGYIADSHISGMYSYDVYKIDTDGKSLVFQGYYSCDPYEGDEPVWRYQTQDMADLEEISEVEFVAFLEDYGFKFENNENKRLYLPDIFSDGRDLIIV